MLVLALLVLLQLVALVILKKKGPKAYGCGKKRRELHGAPGNPEKEWQSIESCVSRLLFGINVPDNVVWQTIDAIAGALGHLGKAFSLGLVLECIAREIDA